MLIAKKGEALVEIIGFNGGKATIQAIIENPKEGFQYGPEEEVNGSVLSAPCVTTCYDTAKLFHGITVN
ncbi:MAG: hypothetical protein WCJ57_01805 [Candidatus Falkowbacteria bacterium]